MMRYRETVIPGVVLLEPDPFEDERGLFARTWDVDEASSHGLDVRLAQCSTSYNRARGTLRGMHYQEEPYAEAKVVRCTSGSVFDVAVDLRPDSPTYLRWTAAHLSADNRAGLYIPPGCAHGFLTLTDGAEVYYQISVRYVPGASRGLRWDDPVLAIDWPEAPDLVSEKDRAWPLLP